MADTNPNPQAGQQPPPTQEQPAAAGKLKVRLTHTCHEAACKGEAGAEIDVAIDRARQLIADGGAVEVTNETADSSEAGNGEKGRGGKRQAKTPVRGQSGR